MDTEAIYSRLRHFKENGKFPAETQRDIHLKDGSVLEHVVPRLFKQCPREDQPGQILALGYYTADGETRWIEADKISGLEVVEAVDDNGVTKPALKFTYFKSKVEDGELKSALEVKQRIVFPIKLDYGIHSNHAVLGEKIADIYLTARDLGYEITDLDDGVRRFPLWRMLGVCGNPQDNQLTFMSRRI